MAHTRNLCELITIPRTYSQALTTISYASVWIAASGAVIIYNKWILSRLVFPFPIALTMVR